MLTANTLRKLCNILLDASRSFTLSHLPTILAGGTLLTRFSFDVNGTTTYSTNGIQGTLYGGPTYTSGGLTFKGSRAVVAAGGAKQYLSLPSTAFGAFTSVSIEMWVTTAANNPSYATLFGWSQVNWVNDLYICREASSNVLVLGYHTSGPFQGSGSTASFDAQKNMHLVLTVAPGDRGRLYKNGELVAVTASAIAAFIPPAIFHVGNNFAVSPSDYGFQGSIKEFRIWGGILSPSDVSGNFLQGPGQIEILLLLLPSILPIFHFALADPNPSH